MKTFQNLLALTLSLVALASCGISGQPGEGSSLDLQGEKGDKGDNGNSVLTGEGVPANSLGNDGDSYIDTTTFDFYTKSAGAWEKKGNIKGDKGNQGAPGEDGLDGKPGKNGENGTDGSSVLTDAGAPSDELGADGDFYVDTTAFDTYKKENGSWVKGGNIKGDKGDKGEDAIPYYGNTFLPGVGGYLASDKGSYAAGETIKISSFPQNGYQLDGVEVIYDGVKTVYGATNGLDDFLSNGIVAKENGYVFHPVFSDTTKKFDVTDITTIGSSGDGTYTLKSDTYGEVAKGITLAITGGNLKIQGQTTSEGKPATTIYVKEKSTFSADYVTVKNINFALADDYADSSSVLEFAGSFASLENCTISITKSVECALNFKAGSFGIKDVSIHSLRDAAGAFLKTAVLFGEKDTDGFSNVEVNNLVVNDVKKAQNGVYAGSVFKSFVDTPYFQFKIKNSKFGTAETPLGEIWAHYRQKDYISSRFGPDAKLYAKYKKTASVVVDSSEIYSDLVNDYPDSYVLNLAAFTFHVNETISDDTSLKRCFADILFQFNSSKVNGSSIDAAKIKYGEDGCFPMVTLYQYYEDESLWYGCEQINTYQSIFPYAEVNGNEASLASGAYPY